MPGPMVANTAARGGTGPSASYGPALALLASLFFMWGFITVINNTLLPHLRSVFELNYFQTGLIESVWFIGYLLASIPAAKLIERIGYQRALTTGLGVMTLGSLGMILAASMVSYGVTVASLFVVSCGIALLQVAANPYVAVIGPPETAEGRLTLVQAFNTTGDVLAIIFGKYLILARTTAGTAAHGTQLTEAQRMADAQATELPYLIVAIVLALLAILIARAKLPALGAATQRANAEDRKGLSLWSHRNLILGCVGIALCVLGEIGVSSYFINFVSQPDVANLAQDHAASYLLFFWGGMMVGRFAGAALMRKIAAQHVLALFSLIALAGTLTAALVTGPLAMYGLIVSGLGISIMFPAIFALAIRGLGPLTEEGSGLLIMSIAGGAVPGFWRKPAGATGRDWWRADDPTMWDWTQDANQRWWLGAIKARVEAPIFEAFSNSPPWFMTVSGRVSGADKATDDNLRPGFEAPFAAYLARVVDELQRRHGIAFRTLSPVNEPNTDYWFAANKQEGAHWSPARQAAMIDASDAALKARGLKTVVAAPDETNSHTFLTDWAGYPAATRARIGQLNVHSYGAIHQTGVRDVARSSGIRLWMSENDAPLAGDPENFDGMASPLAFAEHVVGDLKRLEPAAWVFWQAVEDLSARDGAAGSNWGLVKADQRSLAGGPHPLYVTRKYWAMAQFSRFIRPGYRLVPVDDMDTAGARSPGGDRLVMVHVNPAPMARRLVVPTGWRVQTVLTDATHDAACVAGVAAPPRSIVTLVLTRGPTPADVCGASSPR